MLSYGEAANVLADLIDELPDEIFRELNGGVMLMEEAKTEEDGSVTLGTYFVNNLGRYVELYYGSFTELYGETEDERFRERLKKTLHHELTHHVESMAGDRSLERWDERQAELCGFNGIEVHSILFTDDDCSALAPAAEAIFNANRAGYAAAVSVSSAAVGKACAEINLKAAKVCAGLGADISRMRPVRVSRELMEKYDVVLCMTAGQAELLSQQYQDLDDRIMCLAMEDIEPPSLPLGWKRCIARLNDAVLTVIDELNILED
ncbi:MAG: hypothetical protein HUJ66_03225 [Oscillospiraceae bacterium]|nr:hypothetical protein [Oscillospiraceae bacterium]